MTYDYMMSALTRTATTRALSQSTLNSMLMATGRVSELLMQMS